MSNDIRITVNSAATPETITPETIPSVVVKPIFKTELEAKALIAGVAESWVLPEIEEGAFALETIELSLPEKISSLIELT